MQSDEIRTRFLKFFEKRGHAIIPSASLVPENDPSVLFTTAGMQPLAPYLLGQPHPKGKRLADIQKCVRTGDIDEIGDATHATFFEMLGNWSLGDYFKEDAIKWSYEFLTNDDDREAGDKGLGLDPQRLYVTVFEGNDDAPRDDESAKIWEKIFKENGVQGERIYYLPAEKNWWSPGDNGPCGPDTEMFYDVTGKLAQGMTKEAFLTADKQQDVVEVWNDVFMEYEKKDGKVIGKLKQKNVDTGAGLERLAMILQEKNNIFDTDIFALILDGVKNISWIKDKEHEKRIIADHIRTATLLISDGVMPSNTDRGYIVRKLIRRAIAVGHQQLLSPGLGTGLSGIAKRVIATYGNTYPNLSHNRIHIEKTITEEEEKFRTTLARGLKKFEGQLSSKEVFDLFQTDGFPPEVIKEIARGKGIIINWDEFNTLSKKHQELSRAGAEQKFKGGLANANPKTVHLHTATHLMLAGLRKYLGNHVHQAGSNITEERTRFDFTHPEKVSPDILKKVEEYVNEAIAKECTVVIEQMPKDEAQKTGVEGSFWEKYPDTVNVYMVKAPTGEVYSRELCGGPHVGNTKEIGKFKIVKEEAVAAGIRRIKAVVG